MKTSSVVNISAYAFVCIKMTFVENLSKINKFAFLFGISPCSLNRKSNKFECSAKTLLYTFCYFLAISIPIIYISFAYYLSDETMFQSMFMILSVLQQATVIIIFCSSMLDLMLKRQRRANFLNLLVELDSKLAKFDNNENRGNDLLALYQQNIFVVCFHATVCLTNSILHRNRMEQYEHAWNGIQFFQTASLTLAGYYIRNFAIILHHRCSPIFESLNSIGNDLRYTSHNENSVSELMNCFDAFDEVMNLKKQLSSIYGIQLLLNSAFDFIMLTISVYGMLYFQTQNFEILFYFSAYNLPHAIKCVLLVLALDTLANQVIITTTTTTKTFHSDKFLYGNCVSL